MPDSVGTRSQQGFRRGQVDQGSETRTHTRDLGMKKRVVTAATFTAGNGRITGANGDFANFAVQDQILVEGTNLNNGFKTVTGIDAADGAYVVVSPPPKDEAGVANTLVRAA